MMETTSTMMAAQRCARSRINIHAMVSSRTKIVRNVAMVRQPELKRVMISTTLLEMAALLSVKLSLVSRAPRRGQLVLRQQFLYAPRAQPLRVRLTPAVARACCQQHLTWMLTPLLVPVYAKALSLAQIVRGSGALRPLS
jgi:hypothetical protein